MSSEDIFIKELSDYLDIEFSEFDKKKISGLLEQYKDRFPPPKQTIIYKEKIVYKTQIQIDEEVEEGLLSPSDVIRTVSKITGVGIHSITGNLRTRERVEARHISFYLIKKYCTNLSLSQIGRYFGNKDHASVIHGVKQINDKLDINDYTITNIVNMATEKLQKKTA